MIRARPLPLIAAGAALAIAGTAMILAPALRGAEPVITVVDGDTVRADGESYRLVGFDAPEAGRHARCATERRLADAATARLRALIADGAVLLTPVACSCRPGTEGTRTCNYGRRCGRLTAHGKDAGDILIGEGLARPYVCGTTSCPRRQGWCSGNPSERAP
jgi:endonuclease YncB( thermonuclease family)